MPGRMNYGLAMQQSIVPLPRANASRPASRGNSARIGVARPRREFGIVFCGARVRIVTAAAREWCFRMERNVECRIPVAS
jgi:hypothetical protein